MLVLDEGTTRVLGAACRMSDLNDAGVSLVEDLHKGRQPMPTQEAVYFVQPTARSVSRLIDDFAAAQRSQPPYRGAHVFFSSPLPREQLARIKDCSGLVARLLSLKEANLEFRAMDGHAFTTLQDHAMERLFGGDPSGAGGPFQRELRAMAQRLATFFCSLKEFPSVRFQAPAPQEDSLPGAQARALLPQRVAALVHQQLAEAQGGGEVPSKETCDLLIVDRSVDAVAPVIHEWTYEAMVYDLLEVKDGIYHYTAETNAGKQEKHVVLLDESDPVWVELRHRHIAEASAKLNDDMNRFTAGNKIATARRAGSGGGVGGGGGGGIDTRDLKGMVESLPQYRDQLRKLALHIDVASSVIDRLKGEGLEEIGKLEQELVYGDATSKELIKLLGSEGRSGMSSADKVRLLMCYVATHPEKLDNNKRLQWMKLAKLTAEEMNAVDNLEYLGVAVSKRGGKGLTFGKKGRKKAIRKERAPTEGEEGQWELSRFQPLLRDIMEDHAKGLLSTDDFPYVLPPTQAASAAADSFGALSVRTTGSRAGGGSSGSSWAGKKAGAGSARGDKASAPQGRRLVVFIIGGMARSEMRVAHALSESLQREVFIGSTSVDAPLGFIEKLQNLSSLDDIEL